MDDFLIVLNWPYIRDINIECSKQLKSNLYVYVSGQSRPIWAVLFKTALWNLNRLIHIQFNVWGVSYFFRNLSEHRNGVLGEFNQSKKKGSSKSSRSKRKHSFVCFLSSIYPRRFVMRGQTRPISSFEQQGRKNVWNSGGMSSNVVGIICPPYLEYG